eukprot:1898560-Karenia_brevis.AAC.1
MQILEANENGWWCTLRLDDSEPYVDGQNQLYDKVACESGRHSDLHDKDGSMIWDFVFYTIYDEA